jgi:hypothetical protein
MPDELCLPILVGAMLLWYLACTLCQMRITPVASPHVVWREATTAGWTEWSGLTDVPASAGYDAILDAVRSRADAGAVGVQFAIVTQPDDAPAFTLRVLFMSAVRERISGRDLVAAGSSR